MPRYTDSQYQKLAKAIVKDHVDSEASLSDSFQKVAGDLKLNAHEARRLLQATNTTAHLELFEKMGADRYVEFTPLDPAGELGDLFDVGTKEASVVVATDEYALSLALPNEHWDSKRDAVEKVASEMVPDLDEPPPRGPYEGVRGYNAMRLIEKTAEELEMELRVAHLDYEDSVDKLASMLRRVDAIDYPTFEKDAWTLHGDDVVPVMVKVRETLRRDMRPPLEKVANRYVISRREHVALSDVVSAFRKTRKYAVAHQTFQAQSAPLVRT